MAICGAWPPDVSCPGLMDGLMDGVARTNVLISGWGGPTGVARSDRRVELAKKKPNVEQKKREAKFIASIA